ncbi:putative mitochondrial membrane protein FMP10 [Podospora fimiseda]|uniref:Mitochondrial membrane protein FMP10 n=1 Tax=Podospora fimiseda TaxID=252190 RepID=A0AAN7BV16_9PEZI|nr:putative mitochondrial membrane protein FMP10 [Podospora fimiseda]
MSPRIPTRPLLRLAQGQVCKQSHPSFFSTSSLQRRQELRQEPAVPVVPETIPASVPKPEPTASSPNPPPKKKKKSYGIILAASCLLIGTTIGSSARLLISPPTPPEPGSEEDEYTISVLHEQASKLPIVKQLSSDPSWESWPAYKTISPEHRAGHITANALQGSRGVGGYQQIFHNKETGELISVIHFGASTVGWPGVVHGGLLATILDESCGRAAFKQWGGLTGVTANLTLQYKKATLANGFYVIKVKPRAEEDLPDGERGKRHYKCYVDATVEEPASGKVTVQAEALFVGGEGRKKGQAEKRFWGGKVRDEHLQF